MLGQAELHLGLPKGGRGPSSWNIVHYLPSYLSRELDQKESSWDSNWHCSLGYHHDRWTFNPLYHDANPLQRIILINVFYIVGPYGRTI